MTKTTRQKQALETREKLLGAALQLFSQKGFKESTVKEIGKQAGVTDGLIYHYFRSKEELLWAVLQKYTINRPLYQSQFGIDATKSLEDQLVKYFELMFKHLWEQKNFVVMCFAESQRNPKIHEQLLRIIQQGCQQLTDFIRSRGNKKEVDQITIQNLITSQFFYFIMWDRFADNEMDRTNHIEKSVSDFVKVIS
ncbi:TetR/AcrR family transcriptional regulator [Risungbinella massiliensis]|uniref:TetR/AcrR family transcriptional regulator n=1 Tax=Risungbinella massiliensis TaxID=1329796 RepID=UPI0005CBF968|nr:TetR/AcrR family transcriptional regulator [Risungbinella massiliensis]